MIELQIIFSWLGCCALAAERGNILNPLNLILDNTSVGRLINKLLLYAYFVLEDKMSVVNHSIDIHLLTNCSNQTDKYLNFIDICANAGISHLQLRQKRWHFNELLAFGKELKTILAKYHIPLIVNDDLKLAIELDAQGVHLGQSDTPVKEARKALGNDKIIGLSIENDEELHLTNQLDSINYVAASAVFPSKTKYNLKKIWGLQGLKQFCSVSKHPVVAIGGINCENACQVISSGVAGIAVISAIHDAVDPGQCIRQLKKLTLGSNNEFI